MSIKKILIEFIEIFKNETALWKTTSSNYKNKNAKKKSWIKLLNKYKEIDEDANIDTVKRKINSLRSSYKRELMKIEKSQKSGASDDDVHVPSLWYFHQMDFLRDQRGEMEDIFECVDVDESIDMLSTPKKHKSDDEEFQQKAVERCIYKKHKQHEVEFQQKSTEHCVAKKRKNQDLELQFLKKAVEHLQKSSPDSKRDEASVFGEGWAMIYRKLNNAQKIFTKRLIDEALALGQLDQLICSSKIMVEEWP